MESSNTRIVTFISILTAIITLAAGAITGVHDLYSRKLSKHLILDRTDSARLKLDTSYFVMLQKMQELSIQSSKDTIGAKELQLKLRDSINMLKISLSSSIDKYENQKKKEQARSTETGFTVQKFWIKVIFSSIFCIAALYVVLSKKYDDETKKWAFSVLTLIAGVWIGSL